jgi:hypothetical protein
MHTISGTSVEPRAQTVPVRLSQNGFQFARVGRLTLSRLADVLQACRTANAVFLPSSTNCRALLVLLLAVKLRQVRVALMLGGVSQGSPEADLSNIGYMQD